jgi:uncharacterized protein involved in exopolysaccharide biosynthesis
MSDSPEIHEVTQLRQQLAEAQARIQEQQVEYATNAETIQALKARVQALEKEEP